MEQDPFRLRSGSLTSSSSSSLTGHTTSRKKILVITGGSGMLGSHIARLAYNHWEELREIRIFDCSPPEPDVITGITGFTPPPGKPKVSYHYGDLTDEDSLSGGFVKASVVIHCAALVENGSVLLRRKMKKVNIDGTHKVVQACLQCGVSGLVYTGSLCQVIGTNHKKPVRFDESYHPRNDGDLLFPYYGGSKNEAENLVLLANGQEGRGGVKLTTCSLRCPTMYGEGDQSFIPTSIRAAKHCFGYFIPIGLTGGSGRTMQSLYVGNAAWGHVLAAKKLLEEGSGNTDGSSTSSSTDLTTSECDGREDIGGKFYYIGDHSPICSMTNFCSQFIRPLGHRVLPLGVPFFLVTVLVFFLEFLSILLAFLHIDIRSPITRGSLGYLKTSHSFSWGKAKKDLGYTPLYSHETTLAKSMEFYRKVV